MPVRLRRMTQEEIEDSVPNSVRNEMPEDEGFLKLRFTIKNLASTPETAKQLLKAKGYHVRKYGEGFNFAVQKSMRDETGTPMAPDPSLWRVVDPDRWDDTIYDLVDLLSDVGVGAAAAAGGALGALAGPVGAAAGAGAGAGIGELARQGLGAAAGIDNNMNLGEAGMQAGLNAALPGAGKILGWAGKKALPRVSELSYGLASKVAGLRDTPGLLGIEALAIRAATMGERIAMPAVWRGAGSKLLPKGELPEAIELVDILRAHMSYVEKFGFSEKTMAGQIRNASKAHVRFGPALKKLIVPTKAITTDDVAELGASHNLIERIMTELGVPSTVKQAVPNATAQYAMGPIGPINRVLSFNERMRLLRRMRVPVQTAHEVLGNLDNYISRRTGEAALGKYKVSAFTKDTMGAAREMRHSIARVLGPQYQRLNTITKIKVDTRDKLLSKVGEANVRDSVANAENFMLNLFNRGKSAELRLLDQYDGLFGTSFNPLLSASSQSGQSFHAAAKLAASGERFGPKGRAKLFPKLTATGGVMGASLFGGTAAATGSVLTGGAAVAAAVAVASPRGVVNITRGAQALFAGASAAGHRLAPTMRSGAGRTAGFSAVSEAAREAFSRMAPDKPIARESAEDRFRKRKLILR